MKNTLVFALSLLATSAHAGTCAAPGPPLSGGDGMPAVSGTTCGADSTFGGAICTGSQPFHPTTTVAIYELIVGSSNDFELSVQDTAPYNAAVALIGPGACGPTAPCYAAGSDASPAGGGEYLPEGGGHFPPNIPAGSYYAAIFSFDVPPNNCGEFYMIAFPYLPVELQSFTVG